MNSSCRDDALWPKHLVEKISQRRYCNVMPVLALYHNTLLPVLSHWRSTQSEEQPFAADMGTEVAFWAKGFFHWPDKNKKTGVRHKEAAQPNTKLFLDKLVLARLVSQCITFIVSLSASSLFIT